ncbi:MAG: translocation/assembly module TamB, partial [Tannerella sp.]|nr:translocation/assembly module TamB [Tannerella sp.]
MLNIPFVQRKMVVFSETELSKLLKTSVTIGDIDVSWLNRVVLKDVLIEDQKGDILLKADHITAGFKLLPILKNKWILTTVRLFGVTCHIQKETSQSDTNLQFIIDALSGDSQGDSYPVLQIESIHVRRGKISYDVLDKEHANQAFNPNHITIENLSGKLSVKHYNKDSIHAIISKLSFNELAGLKVNKVSAGITGNKDSLYIDNLSFALPHSSIFIPSAAIRFAQPDSLPLLADQTSLAIRLAPSTIAPKDFTFLTPVLKDFSDVVDISVDISGFINSLSLNQLTLTYGSDMRFFGSMDLKNAVNKEEELYLFGQVKNMNVTTKGLQRLKNNFNLQNIPLPEPVMNLEELNFSGEISGFTDHLVAFGNLSTAIGSVQMDMLIGQQRNRDTSLYLKGFVATSDLQINSLFDAGNPFGKTRFHVEFDLAQLPDKSFSGAVDAQINEFEYLNYNYENIYLSGKFKENEYEGLVKVNDANGQLEMQGLFRNEDEKSVFDFLAKLTHFHPDKLHLTDRF